MVLQCHSDQGEFKSDRLSGSFNKSDLAARAFQLQELGRHRESIDCLLEALTGGDPPPFQSLLWAEIGYNNIKLEEWNKAQEALHTAIELDSENFDAQNYLGFVHLQKDKPEKAEKVFRSVLAQEPHNIESMRCLCLTYLDLGEFTEAERVLSNALSIAPNNMELQSLQIRVSMAMLNKKDEAEILLGDFMSQFPEEQSGQLLKAASLLNNKKYKQAKEMIFHSMQSDPNNAYAKYLLLEVYKSQNPILRFFVGNAFNTYIIQWSWWLIPIFIIATNGVFLWGGFFIFYMLITWLGGVLFNSLIRLHPRMKLLLLKEQILQSNFFIGAGILCAVSSVAASITKEEWLIKIAVYLLLIIFIGISYFELETKNKKDNFKWTAGTMLFFGGLLAFWGDLFFAIPVLIIFIILHGILFTFRAIAK